ncbi:MAG: hypothetical protein Unbinned4204contig1001_15 [Prokaryotic dsDNA virus sp.]|nr:MAG: hypothetical protein Unbinned4204contig1001_15 [Prokaryotic dsDNA virus sp.]|tara:strand:+ start:15573 stop:15938 length:366 start_codon:yes stop_codon:yes gene_type:complete
MKQLRDRMMSVRDQYYKSRRKRGFTAFWFSSPLHTILVLEVAIADASSKSINFEAIVKLLPSSMGSRSTVATVLEDFVARGYMCKKVGKDKRKRDYIMCPGAMKLLNEWFVERQRSLKAVS